MEIWECISKNEKKKKMVCYSAWLFAHMLGAVVLQKAMLQRDRK